MEHEVDAGKVDGSADDGEYPVDVGARCPAEDEETDGDTDTTDQSDLQANFRCEATVTDEAGLDMVLLIETWKLSQYG